MDVIITPNDVFTLCWWWAAWSLADTYLLRLSPCSELVVLAVCSVIYAWPGIKNRMNSGLKQVTQTADAV